MTTAPHFFQCFYCGTEKEYDDLCNRMRQELIDAEKTPLFELVPTRPDYMKDDSSLEGASGRCKSWHSYSCILWSGHLFYTERHIQNLIYKRTKNGSFSVYFIFQSSRCRRVTVTNKESKTCSQNKIND